MENSIFRMNKEQLEGYMKAFRNRAYKKKKGNGSYTRKEKHKGLLNGKSW